MDDEERRMEEELEYSQKSKIIAFTLWFGLFGCGAHRMYLNRLWSGLCQLGLLILLIFGTLVFFVVYMVADTYFVDGEGLPRSFIWLSFGFLGVSAVWLPWALIDGFFIPRWLREDTDVKRAEIAARYRA
ncbi:MAG: NINE protein [Pseudomonadota bacterium]